MKVLIVSLLRMGDVLLSIPMMSSLKKEFKNIEIHYLVNESSEGISSLFPEIKWHFLPRRILQKGLGEFEIPFFESYHLLNEKLHEWNRENFSLLINVTHNKLSGWLCAAIEAQQKIGLVMDRQSLPSFGSPWFRYYNEYGGKEGSKKELFFHCSDVFSYGVGLSPVPLEYLKDTRKGIQEAKPWLVEEPSPFVLIQSLTSDNRKNLSIGFWVETLKMIHLLHVHAPFRFLLLGAPDEKEYLTELLRLCHENKIPASLAISSIPAALTLLKRAQLLITGDTGIKHLASLTRCPVLELSLGPSDLRKTGVYSSGNWIIQSNESCAPCPQGQACPHLNHPCEKKISPQLVALVADRILKKEFQDMGFIASEFQREATLYKTLRTHSDYWMAQPLKNGGKFEDDLCRYLDFSVKKMFLTQEHLQLIGEFGTEGNKIRRTLNSQDTLSVDFINEMETHLKQFEKEEELNSLWLKKLLQLSQPRGLKKENYLIVSKLLQNRPIKLNNDDQINLEAISEFFRAQYEKNKSSYLRQDNLIELSIWRKLQKEIEELMFKSDIRLKLIRSIQSQGQEVL